MGVREIGFIFLPETTKESRQNRWNNGFQTWNHSLGQWSLHEGKHRWDPQLPQFLPRKHLHAAIKARGLQIEPSRTEKIRAESSGRPRSLEFKSGVLEISQLHTERELWRAVDGSTSCVQLSVDHHMHMKKLPRLRGKKKTEHVKEQAEQSSEHLED